jgi:hypothetical protein
MRWMWLITVPISVLGCKDPEPAKAPAPRAPVPAGSGVAAPTPAAPPAGSAAIAAPATPRLDPNAAAAAFDSETEDRDWAINTERVIKTAAPELADIDCKQQQCRATMTADTEAELVAKTTKLESEDGLRGTEAHSILLTAPQVVNGKLAMKIYVRFER